jgi:hypothetical protein
MYKVGTVARMKGVVLGMLLRGGFFILTPLISLGAGSVNLAWDASGDTGIAAYNIYYGTSSHSYQNQVLTGTNLSAVISGLAGGKTYYFAVTEVDSFGNESAYSNEISYSIAGVNQPPTISAIAGQSIFVGQSAGPIAFAINDPDTGPTGLILSAFSSNTALVPNANIVFGGSGQNRTVTITPAAGQTGSAEITITVSDGSLTAQSSFALNVTQATAMLKSELGKSSTFSGLFYESDAVRLQSAGAFKLTATSAGKYSGTLQMAAGHYSFSGQFGTFCQGTNVIVRKGAGPLSITFSVKNGGSTGQVAGNLSDGTWTAQVYGEQAAYNSKTNPAPYAGTYTLEIPGEDSSGSFTLGNGFGSVSVDGNGNVKFAGSLADGSKVSQSAPLSKDGTWPFFAPLYKGQGLVMGWISFTNRSSDDLHGPLNWIKMANAASRYYPGGLSVESDTVGSAFVAGAQPPLVFGAAKLQLGATGGALMMSLKLSTKTGVFTGTMLNRVTGKPVPFQGALLQKINAGYGFLLGTNESTPVMLTP